MCTYFLRKILLVNLLANYDIESRMFQPLTTFSCEVAYILPFWGILGPTGYYDVTVGVNIASVEILLPLLYSPTPELL